MTAETKHCVTKQMTNDTEELRQSDTVQQKRGKIKTETIWQHSAEAIGRCATNNSLDDK